MENRVAGAQARQASPRSSISAFAQFTPGPWKWWTSNSWKRLKRDDRGILHITQNVLEPFVCRDGHSDLSVSDADMHLIAAAPEMYEALKAARLYVECCTEPNTPAEEALALLDAALRKAEGGV